MMYKWIMLTIAVCALSGCVSNSQTSQLVYVNASDGTPVTDQAKFQDAKTICIAESDKMAEPEANNNAFIEFDERLSYLKRKDNVVRGCMLEKGYRLITVSADAAPNLSVPRSTTPNSPHLGLRLIPVPNRFAALHHLPPGRGLLVTQIIDGMPASRADVRPEDVITAIDGQPVNTLADVRTIVSELKGKHKVSIDRLRDGVTKTTALSL